jgi:hypothetical protein
LQFFYNVGFWLVGIQVGQPPKIPQLIVVDVRAVLLRKQICKNPVHASFGHNDRPVLILAKSLLENPSPKSSACPSITCRIAAQSSSSSIRAFRPAFENHAVLKTRRRSAACFMAIQV